MTELVIHPESLNRMFTAMYKVGDQSADLDDYFGTYVCSTAGFDFEACALKPLADVMPTIDGYFGDMQEFFSKRWLGLVDATYMSAREVDLLDGNVDWTFRQYQRRLPEGVQGPVPAAPALPDGALSYFQIEDLTLGPPEEGDRESKGTFDTVAQGWEGAVATINWGIGILKDLGVGGDLKEIDTDLRGYIVYPLSGDYGQIIANANACQILDDAMQTWGDNFGKLALQVPGAMEGQAANGLIAQLGLYDVAMKGIGFVIGEAKVVYQGIAKVSGEIADVVEKVLGFLGEKLLKTASRFASKFVPGVGWASLLWDAARGKLDDYVKDVIKIWELINKCFEIIDEVTAWAESCKEQLEKLQGIVDKIKLIPGVNTGGTLDDLSGDIDKLKEQLQKPIDYGNYATDKKDELDSALDELTDVMDE